MTRGTLDEACAAGTCSKHCPCYTDHEMHEYYAGYGPGGPLDKPPCPCVDCVAERDAKAKSPTKEKP